MPSNTSPDAPLSPDRCRRASAWLAGIAIAGLAGTYLLISPDSAAETIKPWPAGSWLLKVVRVQALYYVFPTPRGTEIKEVLFHLTAGILAIGGAATYLLCRRSESESRPGGFRAGLRSPATWFAAAIVISALAALACNAPRAAAGGTVIRFLWFAWWWPLAIVLPPQHARRVVTGLVVVASVTAGIGLWYRQVRSPHAPLGYPFGNQLFLAACLLPPLLIAGTLGVSAVWSKMAERPWQIEINRSLLWLLAAGALLAASLLTESRSANLGFGCGLLTIVYLAADRVVRGWMRIGAAVVVGLLAGALLLFRGDMTRTLSAMFQRSESIRARVDHEWPFAIKIFADHWWLGGGEGGFGRLVGPLARSAQMHDPLLLKADGSSWEMQAHNEVLEMLTSMGLFGTLAMVLALLVTLRAAIKTVDLPGTQRTRVWVIALTGGLVAGCAEELTDVALHLPGYAPVLLTVWACLWALVRDAQPRSATIRQLIGRESEPSPGPDGAPSSMRAGWLRTPGIGVLVIGAVVATGLGVFNASAIRALHNANERLQAGRPHEAIAHADRATTWRLDPGRRLASQVVAMQARIRTAQSLGRSTNGDDTSQAAELCREVLAQAEHLQHIAPRFLQSFECEALASAILTTLAEARGEQGEAARLRERARLAFRKNREDEPFRIEAVQDLWRADPSATVEERVRWLRDVLRGGGVDSRWDELLRSVGDAGRPVIDALLETAEADLSGKRRQSQWRDPLAPETFRLAARAENERGRWNEATKYARKAAEIYSLADKRLDQAHAAALHEQVLYSLDTDKRRARASLDTLNRAHRLATGREPTGPLSYAFGRTRLSLLLILDDAPAARAQAEQLARETKITPEEVLANAYFELTSWFGEGAQGELLRNVFEWARRSAFLDPRRAEAHLRLAAAAIQLNIHDIAGRALQLYRRTERDSARADSKIQWLREAFPDSPIWRPSPHVPATAPAATSQAASG